MNKTKYILMGLIVGYFMALGCDTRIVAQDHSDILSDSFPLGSQFNPMYVKIVD